MCLYERKQDQALGKDRVCEWAEFFQRTMRETLVIRKGMKSTAALTWSP